MSAARQRPFRRVSYTAVALLSAGALVAGCTSNEPESSGDGGGTANAASDNDEEGETVRIGFSAPAADHGWMAGITEAARQVDEEYDDVELIVAEGTNDVSTQISQVETFINEGVDAIVLLPFDGAAMTPVALQAMEAGIPVINVDREFDSPFAARATILGDNYGMGVSAGTYICEELGDQPGAVVAEIAGIDSLPLTQDRSQGFADALGVPLGASMIDSGLDPSEVQNKVAAYLSANPDTDAILTLGPNSAEPTIRAVKDAGLEGDDVVFATFDLSAEIAQAIKDGVIDFAVDQQPFLQGYLPVVFLTNYARYGVIPANDVNSGPGFITADNISQVEALAGKYR